jgi:hypothetical protein
MPGVHLYVNRVCTQCLDRFESYHPHTVDKRCSVLFLLPDNIEMSQRVCVVICHVAVAAVHQPPPGMGITFRWDKNLPVAPELPNVRLALSRKGGLRLPDNPAETPLAAIDLDDVVLYVYAGEEPRRDLVVSLVPMAPGAVRDMMRVARNLCLYNR